MLVECENCCAYCGGKETLQWEHIIPMVLGKYLKLVFEHHENVGTLDAADLNADGKLDVYDLGVAFLGKNKDVE